MERVDPFGWKRGLGESQMLDTAGAGVMLRENSPAAYIPSFREPVLMFGDSLCLLCLGTPEGTFIPSRILLFSLRCVVSQPQNCCHPGLDDSWL